LLGQVKTPAGFAKRIAIGPMKRRPTAWGVLFVLGLTAVGYVAYRGYPYYRLPQIERVHHPYHWTWKPGGSVGHLLGIVGSTMMILMLSYSLRKRWRRLSGIGTLRHWLNLHMFFGVIGPLLVILHSAFRVHGLVALSFWSMVIVALSGVVGRYLYVQIPRTRLGTERSREELQQELDQVWSALRAETKGGDLESLEHTLQRLASIPNLDRPALWVLFSLVLGDLIRPWTQRRILHDALSGIPRTERLRLQTLLLRAATLERRVLMFDRLQEIFHYWHVFHKPFAAVMYLFMLVHIAVALWTGYGWR